MFNETRELNFELFTRPRTGSSLGFGSASSVVFPCPTWYASLNRMCFGPGHVSIPYASIAEWLVQHVGLWISWPGFVCKETYFEKPYKNPVLRLQEWEWEQFPWTKKLVSRRATLLVDEACVLKQNMNAIFAICYCEASCSNPGQTRPASNELDFYSWVFTRLKYFRMVHRQWFCLLA